MPTAANCPMIRQGRAGGRRQARDHDRPQTYEARRCLAIIYISVLICIPIFMKMGVGMEMESGMELGIMIRLMMDIKMDKKMDMMTELHMWKMMGMMLSFEI